MASAADRQQHGVLGGEPDTVNDVGHATAPDNKGRPSIDHAIPDPPRLVVTRSLWSDHFTLHLGGEVVDSDRIEKRSGCYSHREPPRNIARHGIG
jgi:hypothetical protein